MARFAVAEMQYPLVSLPKRPFPDPLWAANSAAFLNVTWTVPDLDDDQLSGCHQMKVNPLAVMDLILNWL
jgi:hypothetical protein